MNDAVNEIKEAAKQCIASYPDPIVGRYVVQGIMARYPETFLSDMSLEQLGEIRERLKANEHPNERDLDSVTRDLEWARSRLLWCQTKLSTEPCPMEAAHLSRTARSLYALVSALETEEKMRS